MQKARHDKGRSSKGKYDHHKKGRPVDNKRTASSPRRPAHSTLAGTISINSKGVGYVRPEDGSDDIEVAPQYLNTALHGDRVTVALHPSRSGQRLTGEITEVLVRSKPGFAGTIETENGHFFLVPQDTRMYTDILIPKEKLGGAVNGDKAFAVITRWADPRKNPEGEITEVLGRPGDNDAEMHAVALERGFSSRFPENVENEASAIKARGITDADMAGRKDFRGTLTFTIDPEDAKDFDDAISFKPLDGGLFEIGIHIADVSQYVRPGTALDKEAVKRGTSVYLVDRTIPMLPEALSNDLCSLNPNEDKLAMSAVFVLDKHGTVKEAWFGKTIINSDKRFSYEEAQAVLNEGSGLYFEELDTLNKIAKALLKKRFEQGAISMEQEEVRFILDDKGVPVRVYKKTRGDTHKLIEEYMLLANKHVAKFVADREKKTNKGHVFVYRIHDMPSEEKLADLVFFLKSVGYELKLTDGTLDPKELNKLLVSLEGKSEKDMIQTAVVRSMAKAIYSTENIGHYGLAFEYYTHFTSPIRRYPDVLAHRLLDEYLRGLHISEKDWHIYTTLCNYSSQREKEAADAERASVKYKQVEYMSKRIGQMFDGIISGVTEWGIYVEEAETKCEGMVKLRDLGDDFYVFDEKHYRIVGERTKKKYTLGDKVRFKVVKADMDRKTLDYTFV